MGCPALDQLRHGDPDTALATYTAHGRVRTAETAEQLRDRLIDDWCDTARHDLPWSRDDRAPPRRRHRPQPPCPSEAARRLQAHRPGCYDRRRAELQAGDRIVCLRNDRRLGAVNRTRATITGTDPTRRAVEAIDDRGVRLLLPAGYLDAGHVTHGFATYARHAGSPHIGGPHGLRHSLASALDASGNGLATISPRLGHASTAVTSKVYTHMLKGADRAAVDVHAARILPGLVKVDPEHR